MKQLVETAIGRLLIPKSRFFAYAREREAIRIRKEVLKKAWPWTDDSVLRRYRFCNVDREDDRVTRWFKNNVRERLRDKPEVLLATVIFRWFNLVTTGEALFSQTDLATEPPGSTAFEAFLAGGDVSVLDRTIRRYNGKGPYTTGSYMVSSPGGMNKIAGLCQCIDKFNKETRCLKNDEWIFDGTNWRDMARICLTTSGVWTLEDAWKWLRQYEFQGNFNSYEVVTDLRHTELLCSASDIKTWANAGPGARRGLNRIHGRDLKVNSPDAQCLVEMRDILKLCKAMWPKKIEGHTTKLWEMRTVEHTLCEYDKYERVRLGEGRPRGVYKS